MNEEEMRSEVGGIVCQCGNPINIDRVNEYWIAKLKAQDKIARETMRDDIMKAFDKAGGLGGREHLKIIISSLIN